MRDQRVLKRSICLLARVPRRGTAANPLLAKPESDIGLALLAQSSAILELHTREIPASAASVDVKSAPRSAVIYPIR